MISIENKENLIDNIDKSYNDLYKTNRQFYNSLVNNKVYFKDNSYAYIIKRLPSKDMYNELFKRYPTYNGNLDINKLNYLINKNIILLLKNSELTSFNEIDYNNKHRKQGIISFDTRKVAFLYNYKKYILTFSIANLKNNQKIVYAKKYLKVINNKRDD